MKPLKKKKQLIHITNSQHEQHMWLSDADICETKVTAAASRAKYILYITCHSFWVCNLMLAIKNFCAASHGTQFYSIDALKWSFFSPFFFVFFFSCDRLVSPGGICNSKPQSADPHVVFTSNHTIYLQLLTNYQELWAMGKAPKWHLDVFVVQHWVAAGVFFCGCVHNNCLST